MKLLRPLSMSAFLLALPPWTRVTLGSAQATPAMTQARSATPAVNERPQTRRQARAAQRAAMRSKRSDCRAEARARRLGFIQRERYLRRCLRD